MQRIRTSLVVACSFGLLLGASTGSVLLAQDGPDEPAMVSLHGIVDLVPPEGEAGGKAFLRQWGERAAIHVHVGGLEPGATYDVQVIQDDVGESIGSITTYSGEVPPPSHFHARLKSTTCEEPVEEPDDPEDPDNPDDPDEPDGDGHDGRMGDWMDRLRDFLDGLRSHWGHHGSECPGGYAVFVVSSDGAELKYWIHVRRVAEEATAVTLKIGDEEIALGTEDLSGSVEVTEEQLAGIVEGNGSVIVEVGDEVLEGALEARFQALRERIAEVRSGRGALRLDTARGDELPFGATSLEELVGATLAVLDADEEVVLAGVIEELLEGGRWYCRHRDGGEEPDPVEEAEDGVGGFFEMGVPHDASFVRGDANDDGAVDMSDAVSILHYLFISGVEPYCADAADVNDDGEVAISDPIAVLNVLFQGTGTVAPPFPEAGYDPTVDELTCE